MDTALEFGYGPDADRLEVELLSEADLARISGGSWVGLGIRIAAGGLGVAGVGVAVGLAVYYFTR